MVTDATDGDDQLEFHKDQLLLELGAKNLNNPKSTKLTWRVANGYRFEIVAWLEETWGLNL